MDATSSPATEKNSSWITLLYDGNGCCSCIHFAARIKPEIERLRNEGQFHPGPEFKCPHIEKADADLLTLFKQNLIKTFSDNSLETT